MMKAWIAPLAAVTLLTAAPSAAQAQGPDTPFDGWNAQSHTALVVKGGSLYEITAADAAPGALSAETGIGRASWAPRKGDVLVAERQGQLFTLADGRFTPLTDGKSRNASPVWSHDGHWLAYTSNRRTGADDDLYVVDPRDPKSDRLMAPLKGAGWALLDFTADGTSAVVAHRLSAAKTDLFFMDIASGAMRPISDLRKAVAYGDVRFSYDGILWATSAGRLGMIEVGSGVFSPIAERGMTAHFDVSLDGKLVAYVAAGCLKVLDTRTGQSRAVEGVPAGAIDDLHFAPGGTLGFSVTSADGVAELDVLDPATMAVTRWAALPSR